MNNVAAAPCLRHAIFRTTARRTVAMTTSTARIRFLSWSLSSMNQRMLKVPKIPLCHRHLSSSGGGGGRPFGDDNDNDPEFQSLLRETEGSAATTAASDSNSTRSSASFGEGIDDPFGIHFEDGKEGLGPRLPPLYQRDSTTGRFTGEVVAELTEREKQVLAADALEQDALLLDRIESHWSKAGKDPSSSGVGTSTPHDKKHDESIAAAASASGLPSELFQLGERIRLSDMATNVLGRSVKAQATAEQLDDGSELGRDDETGFSQHLTQGEFRTFTEYMKKRHKVEGLSIDDIPVQEAPSSKSRKAIAAGGDNPDAADWSLKWLSARAQRQMDDSLDDNPYSDVMPGDLTPNRVVNRKRAKPIPSALMHHNNLALLQHFISPTGQIRNRMQTRLGARDQRRVARLIKRSRALGLIPFVGQFKAEQHGWVNAPDLQKDRKWEEQLAQRGLVLQKFVPKSAPK